jgi:release factor glutamine methyltransferase
VALDPENDGRALDQDIWTIKRVLKSSFDWLKAKNLDPHCNHRLDSEVMLSDVLGVDRMQLYLDLDRPLNKDERERYRTLLMRRGMGVPVAQIIGHRDFYRHRFVVTKDTLIPRPDTECLVEAAIAQLRPMEMSKILDIGTGSGCIGISIAAAIPNSRIEAWDVSEEVLVVARSNAERLGISNINFVLRNALNENSYGSELFDMIVSNPPYIPWGEKSLCAAETLNFEPHLALFTGEADGLTFYRRFAVSAANSLVEGGKIFLEVGHNQAEKVAHLFEGQGWRKIVMIKDLSGRSRVVVAERQ